MATMMPFMTREVRSNRRGVCSFFLKVDMSAASGGFNQDGILLGGQHFDLAEDIAGVASIKLKNPGQAFVGLSVIADGVHTPVFTEVTDGTEIDVEGLVATTALIRLDVSYAADDT